MEKFKLSGSYTLKEDVYLLGTYLASVHPETPSPPAGESGGEGKDNEMK
jgi:hypothetical protein